MLATLYAITATDPNGNDWIAVKEAVFSGWCAMTPEDVRIRMRMARNKPWPHHRDVYVCRSYAENQCAQLIGDGALPAFEWSVKRFAR